MHNHKLIPCLWSLSSKEIFSLAWLYQFPKQLDGKNILDFGSGISDFLEYVSKFSKPASLTAVDRIYSSQEVFQEALEYTNTEINRLIKITNRQVTQDVCTLENKGIFTTSILWKLAERKRLVENARYKKNTDIIAYETNFKSITRASTDYIFINFLFYIFDEAQSENFLFESAKKLKTRGKLYITDYTHRWNMRRFLKHTHVRFTEMWKTANWDYTCICIDWQNLLDDLWMLV